MSALVIALCHSSAGDAASRSVIAAPLIDNPRMAGASQRAVIAAGCFWGVQGVFEHVRGVIKAVAGYSGGDRSTAHYGVVGLGKSGHVESVEITFDPAAISYGEILNIAFSVVFDPMQSDGQGPDVGNEYRSVIFFADEAQKKIAQAYIDQLERSHVYPQPIVTRVVPLQRFYRAEDYLQDFVERNPSYSYVANVDLPKIENLRRMYPERFRAMPVMALE